MEQRKGFTLVELAIVLVIIGLILGAIVKGQSLVRNAKYKKLVNDLRGLTAAYYTYYDRYRSVPGDDPKAGNRWDSIYDKIENGDGNGLIEDSNANGTNEEEQAWRHLRAAAIIPGDPNEDPVIHPATPYGGVYDFTKYDFKLGSSNATFNCIKINGLPSDIAQRLDEDLDDGIYNRGDIQTDKDYKTTATIDVYYKI